MIAELKTCPFCRAELEEQAPGYFVHPASTECILSMQEYDFDGAPELADLWNRRAQPAEEGQDLANEQVHINFGAVIDALDAIPNDIRPEISRLEKLLRTYGQQLTMSSIEVRATLDQLEGQPQKDRLLAALERAAKAETALRRLVDECENDATPGWEDRMRDRIADAEHILKDTP